MCDNNAKHYPGAFAPEPQAEKCNQAYASGYTPNTSPEEIIERIFTHQPPTPNTLPKFQTIREAGKYFAKVIAQNVPGGVDRLNAILKVREAVMMANAGISLDGYQL